jgi:hypothetical protein
LPVDKELKHSRHFYQALINVDLGWEIRDSKKDIRDSGVKSTGFATLLGILNSFTSSLTKVLPGLCSAYIFLKIKIKTLRNGVTTKHILLVMNSLFMRGSDTAKKQGLLYIFAWSLSVR